MNEKKPEKIKRKPLSNKVWLLISLVVAIGVWYLLSLGKATGRSFPFIQKTFIESFPKMAFERKVLWKDFCSSMICVAAGFGLGFVTAIPMAFLMAWYTPVQKIIMPWINFIRNIPALAYAPLPTISINPFSFILRISR